MRTKKKLAIRDAAWTLITIIGLTVIVNDITK